MNRAGTLVDRTGGGRVVIAGLLMLIAGTVPFTQVSPDTSFWVLAAALVLRGFGLGFTMMPAMAAAYATIDRTEVPRATPMLNVLQRVGGSLGTAVLAVVLERQITAELRAAGAGSGGSASLAAVPEAAQARVAEPLATAFAHTYWWAMAMTALAIVPAAVLAVTERRAARERAAAAGAPAALGAEPSPLPAAVDGARTGAVAADGATPHAPDRSPRPDRAPARLR